nr:MAG TPA_asm: hypothetical protein [Caudoviricetes sp.]DAV88559.1 MAG TPA: hypothetical protein [Caudoviricetes sp.]
MQPQESNLKLSRLHLFALSIPIALKITSYQNQSYDKFTLS